MMTDAQLIALGTRAADEGNVELAALCAYALDNRVPWPVSDAVAKRFELVTPAEARAECARVSFGGRGVPMGTR